MIFLAEELLAVALVATIGFAAILLVDRGFGARRGDRGLALAAALPLGIVVNAALSLPFLLAGKPPTLAGATAVAIAFTLAALFALHRRPAPKPLEMPASWTLGEKLAAAGIVSALAVLGAIAVLEPAVEWDLLAIWGYKAKVLLAGGDWLARLRDPAFAYAHADYPLAWPSALALASTPGVGNVGGGLFGVVLLASAAAFGAAIVRPWGRRAALVAAALIVMLPIAGAQAVHSLADLPLATLVLIAGGALARWTSAGDRSTLALGALATAGLPLVKQEGIALALAVAAIALWRSAHGTRRRAASFLSAAFVVIDLPWLILRTSLPAGAANSLLDMTPARAVAGLSRLPELAALLPVYLGASADWGALWLLVGLALLVLAVRRLRGPALSRSTTDLGLFLVAPTPLYLGALLAAGWEPARLAEVTLARLALHFALLATVVAVSVAAQTGAFGIDPSKEKS
ncbi:MAG: hypothetical protein ABI639_10495 [Thermoanaerobaculia bacterium]